jgi:hypothetical protein
MVKKNNFVPVQDLAGNFVSVPMENITMEVNEIRKRGRPKKYATAEEARKAKIANTIASAKRRKGKGIREIQKLSKRTDLSSLQNRLSPADVEELLLGNTDEPHSNKTLKELKKLLREQHDKGNYDNEKEPNKSIYDELEKRGYGLFSGVIKKVKGAVKAVSNITTSVVKKVKDTASAVVYGRNDYPPKVRDIISKYGDKIITGITIGRTPLGKPLMTALQLASGNTFSQKLENTPYDKLFHLFICIEFGDGKIILEKNEVINAEIGCKLPKDTETKVITSSDIPGGLTLNQALDKTKERMGGKYFTYSAKDNNCQDFIVSFLHSNNIGSETDVSWVKQETKVLFEGNDRLRKIANTLTDIGARFDVVLKGAGVIDFEDMKWGSFSKQLKVYNTQHKQNLDLHNFAMMILANPDKFKERTIKRARFYINVILKKGGAIPDFLKDYFEKLDVKNYFDKQDKHKQLEDDYKKTLPKRGGMIDGGYETPPPTIPLTQAQGNSILNAEFGATHQIRLNLLQNAIDNIGGGSADVRQRYRNWVSGFSNPQQVNRYLRIYDAILAFEYDGATDVESDEGGKIGTGGKQSKVAPKKNDKKKGGYVLPYNATWNNYAGNDPMKHIEAQIHNNALVDETNKQVELKKKKEAEDLRKIRGYGKIKSPVNTKMANSWIEYVKSYAKKNNMKYNEALKDPKCKAGYKKGGKFDLLKSITDVGTKIGEPFKATTGLNPFTFGYDLGHDVIGPALMKGRGIPTSREEYIAQLYDQANLGATGKVKLGKK